MGSEEEHFKAQTSTEPRISPGSEPRDAKLHITAMGNQGKAVRRQLALALGLKPNSSASTSQSEGEETQTNVLEMFRKQVKLKASQKRSRAPEGSSVIRKTNTSTRTRNILNTNVEIFEEGEDFSDYTSETDEYVHNRSRNRSVMNSEKTDHTTSQERSVSSTSKRPLISKDINRTDFDADVKKSLNKILSKQARPHTNLSGKLQVSSQNSGAKDVKVTEEIFSSLGELSEAVPLGVVGAVSEYSNSMFSARSESAKILRERIRKNARARHPPMGVGRRNVSRTQEQREGSSRSSSESRELGSEVNKDRDFSSLAKKESLVTSSSQIPLPTKSKKTLLEKTPTLNSNTDDSKLDKKSRIPRRKSQTSKDGMEDETLTTRRLAVAENEISEEVASSVEAFDNEALFMEKDERSTKNHVDDVNSRKSVQNNKSTINRSSNTLDLSIKNSTDLFIYKNTAIQQSTQEIDSLGTTFDITNKTSNVITHDFDFLESELAKLKVSVYKTYDEFQDMKELTLSLSRELKEIRHI